MSKFIIIITVMFFLAGCTVTEKENEKQDLNKGNVDISEEINDEELEDEAVDENQVENDEELKDEAVDETQAENNKELEDEAGDETQVENNEELEDETVDETQIKNDEDLESEEIKKLELIDLREIYHIEKDKVLYTVKDIQQSMKKSWDDITGGEPLIIAGKEINPERFGFLSGIKMSPCETKIFFGITHYIIAMHDTLTGVIDINTDEITFIDNEVKPGTITRKGIFWCPDEKHVLYTLGSSAGSIAFYIDNIECFTNKLRIGDTTILKEDLEEEQYGIGERENWGRFEKFEWIDNQTIKFYMYYRDKDQYVTKIIDIKESTSDELFYLDK
ncbi:hypothetical protein RBH29_05165 [Herbivorax sp. ANBcel31]|uniref:hypothetical protein n=1 Tax=Herbivorax sp. ANBcel31 TaxID=3069754 RepID=UPI0027B4A830|nr:hypothetical protein [Herbivorax sp. ANBcel31]MDQ2085825.1 hypothetical protein [Herbivorax sp. ANBcel31]